MKIYHLVIIFFAVLPLAFNAQAQDSDEPVRHYDVELILYKNTKVPKSKEYVLPVSSPKRDDEILDLSVPSSIEAAMQKQYLVTPESNFQLSDIVEKITRSSRYELLQHIGWRQPGLEKSQVLPVWIKAGRQFDNNFISIDDQIDLTKATQTNSEENNLNLTTETELDSLLTDEQTQLSPRTTGLYELEGKITIALSRYLHVYTDLVLRKPRRDINSQLKVADSDPSRYENLADTRILDNHQLKEHRRMRSKTLHYLDSPEFSMLIFITLYDPTLEPLDPVLQIEGIAAETTVSN